MGDVRERESSTYNIGRMEKMYKVKSIVLLESVCGDFEMKREIARRLELERDDIVSKLQRLLLPLSTLETRGMCPVCLMEVEHRHDCVLERARNEIGQVIKELRER